MFACKRALVGPALAGRTVYRQRNLANTPDVLPAKASPTTSRRTCGSEFIREGDVGHTVGFISAGSCSSLINLSNRIVRHFKKEPIHATTD